MHWQSLWDVNLQCFALFWEETFAKQFFQGHRHTPWFFKGAAMLFNSQTNQNSYNKWAPPTMFYLHLQAISSKLSSLWTWEDNFFITRLQISKHEDGTPNLPRLICTPIFVLFQKQTKGMGQKNKTKPTSTPSIENAYLSIHQPVYISISKFKLMYAILPLKRSVTFFLFRW